MSSNVLFIVDPLEKLNLASDTSIAFMWEAKNRGLKVYACGLADCALKDGLAVFECAQVSGNFNQLPSYTQKKSLHSIHDFSLVFMRKDPPVDAVFNSVLYMLKCHDPKKTVVINNPDALLTGNEKLLGLKIAPQYFPQSLVSSTKAVLKDFIADLKKVVIKPLFGAGGSGVMVFDLKDGNLNAALELLTNNFSTPIMAQQYVKEAKVGDKRILLLGDKILGALLRVPTSQDHRANFHAGGKAKKCDITKRDQEICDHIGPILKDLGHHFVGIDIIGDYLTEINVTSPTCLRELSELYGKDYAAEVMDYFLGIILNYGDK